MSDDFEIIFDTVASSRKARNLKERTGIAFVIGGLAGGDERSVQYEGVADEPTGADRARLTELYYEVFPDGRERLTWPGLIYVRAKPTWLRYSDYNQNPPAILELDAAALRRLT